VLGIRFSERYIAVLNFLLVGAIVYFLAQSVTTAIRFHLAAAELTTASDTHRPRPVRAAEDGPRPRAYYNTIVERDIFSRAAAPTPAPVENENLDVTLVGTSQLSSGKPFIIVETSDGEQSLYRLGQNIPNVGRVVSIARARAVVLHNGHRVALEIPNAVPGQTPFSPRRRRFMGPMYGPGRRPGVPFAPYGSLGSKVGVHRVSPTRYLVGRATVDRNLANMASLFAQIRATPNLQNGSSNGFRLSEIQPGSIFEQIGLQDGDVVTGAQGQQVSDPMQAMVMLNSLRNSSAIRLSVIRNGSPLQLFYSIR
jgi:type II secretion system protein C